MEWDKVEHEGDTDSPRAFDFPHRIVATADGPVAQQFVPNESGQRFWEDLEAPASVCREILRLAEENKRLRQFVKRAAEHIRCRSCGGSVEPERFFYVEPTCFKCLPPPEIAVFHLTPPAQEAEEPPDTSSPAPRG